MISTLMCRFTVRSRYIATPDVRRKLAHTVRFETMNDIGQSQILQETVWSCTMSGVEAK
jgi:hypothetical protein